MFSNLDKHSLFLKLGVNWPLFHTVFRHFRHKILQSSMAYTILPYTSKFLLTAASTMLFQNLHKGARWEAAIFPLSSLFQSQDMHEAGTTAVQTCWLIISFRYKFVDIKKLVKSTGAINVALYLNPFRFHHCWWWLNSQCWSHISQSSFDGFLCQWNKLHSIHNVLFSYIFYRNNPFTSFNKCTTCL
jgi:hypothetical protein